MAITIPNVFVAGTRIESAPVNANFAAMTNALDKTGDTLTGNLVVGTGITIDGLDISTVPQSGGTFNPNSIVFTNVILGAATTAGIRLDLESGTLAVREGDDSAYGPMLASVYNVPTGGSVNFNAGSAALTWDTTESTANLALSANVDYKLGAQELVRCVNRTGTAIAKGKAVYIVGAHGNRPQIALADASVEATAATTLGITAESIADTAEGFVCISGMLRGLNTNSLTEGQIVWLSETAGELTSTRPTQPAHGVFMGLCVRQQPGTSGILYVSVVNGLELEELHDVLITTPSANQILKRNSGNTLWENSSGAALTKTDDTNVTLTLGGSASTALVNAASLTLGWTGTLASTRLNSNVVQAVTNDTNVTGSISTQTLTLGWTGQLAVGRGGTGASTLTGYVKGSGTAALTASSTIPNTDITGLGTLSTQNASSVSISGGSITGITDLAIADGGTGASTAQGAINALAGATTSGQYLRGNGTNVVMSAIQAGDVPTLNQNTTGTAAGLSATLAVSSGGTGQTSYTDGQLLIGNTATTSLSKATLTAGSGVTITNGNGSITIAATGSGGTVTSVGATSPVASSGGNTPTISLNSAYGDTLNPYGSKTANYVLAAPNGSAGTPSFRALVAADIPTLNQNTTGTAAGLSSTLAVASGGTGQTTYTDGQLLIGNSTGNTLTKATLTAGSGISITNGGGSITIAATGGGGGGGTVTSVSGTGTVNGLSLSGTVTTTGSLTLSGTVDSMSALAGSASAPSIAASGDTNTGIFFPAADTIAFTTGGTERLKIDSSGNISSGVTAAAGAVIDLARDAAVAIQQTRYSTDVNGANIFFKKARGTQASPTAVASGDLMGQFTAGAYGGTNFRNLVSIQFGVSNYTSDTNLTSYIAFNTTNAGTSPSGRFRITGAGDVAMNATAKFLLDGEAATGDTYLVESAANTLSFFAGGTERFRINGVSSGNIAIPAIGRLYLDGVTAAGDTYVAESSANVMSFTAGGTEGFRVEASQATLPTGGSLGWIRGGTSTGPYFQEALGVLRLYTDGAEHFVAFNGTSKRFALNSAQFEVGPGATGSSDIRFKVLGSSGAAGTVVIGHNDASTTPGTQKMTLRGANGSGTNIAGASLFLAAGNGTGTGGSGAIVFETASTGSSGTTANTLTERVRIDRDGNVGINVSTFGTSAAGVLGLKNGTEPTTGPADTVQVYSVDLSAGNTIPAIYTEGTGATTAGITNTTVTNKIAIKINGTVYYLLATTNAT